MVFPKALKVTVLRESGEKENFLLSTDRHMQVCHRFDNLKNEIVVRYPELLQYEEIKFVWIDDEGDEIIILNHADYYDYMDAYRPGQDKRRIYVKGVNKLQQEQPAKQTTASEQQQEAPMDQDSATSSSRNESAATPQPGPSGGGEDLPLHSNIVCDVCDETIRGHRYKCLQCFNYDLCMRCEGRLRHKDHLMVRIPTPEVNRRSPFRLFEKLRSYAAEVGAQSGFAAAGDFRGEDDYENSKRSKRHHRRHSKDREDSKERREEKERKERKQRRERCAKSSEDRRGGHRHRFGHGFNFSHLINQVIDPANIQSAFLSADAAAAAAAAAAESAEEAARASMANCPLFATVSSSHSASGSASASASASTSATTQPEPNATPAATERPQEASTSSTMNAEPQAQQSTSSGNSSPNTPRQVQDMIDLSWLAPTPESILKINQTFSKILDPLGMNIEIRSNGSPKPAQTQTPTEEKKDKTTETANTPTTSTPSQTPPGGAGTSSKATEMDPIVELEKKLEAVLMDRPKSKKTPVQTDDATLASSDEDDCSSVSSVSLLSDNDDSMGAVDKAEKRWTMLDIPIDRADEATMKSSATNVEEAAPESILVAKAPEPAVASTSSMPATPAATATGSYPEAGSASSTNTGSTSKPIDYEQLGKALKQHLEAEQQAAAAGFAPSSPPTPAVHQKEATPPPPPVTVPSPVVSVPSPIPVVQPRPAANVVFSHRPHVNHAVHAMMAMGFSNEGGWLSQLLESVHGDIPRALDLLTPHKINP